MDAIVRPVKRGRLKSLRTLDDKDGAFLDHVDAAKVLLDMGLLADEWRPRLIAFGSGGFALAQELSRRSGIAAAFAAVAELSPAWLGGPVFGAAAFDGTLLLDEVMKEICHVSNQRFHALVEGAYERVSELTEQFRPYSNLANLEGLTAVVVDDGLSAHLSIRVALAAVRNAGAERVIFATPVGERHVVYQCAAIADQTYCASLRCARQRPLAAAYGLLPRKPCLASRRAEQGQHVRRVTAI